MLCACLKEGQRNPCNQVWQIFDPRAHRVCRKSFRSALSYTPDQATCSRIATKSCIKFKLSRGSRVCNCLSSVGLSFDLILEIKSLWSDPILDALRIPNPNLASAMDGRNRWFQIKPQQTFCRLHIWNASLMKKWSDKNQAAWLCTLEGAESIQWLRMQMLGSHVDALQKVWQLILPLGNYCGLQPSDFSAFITYTE